MKLEIFIRGLEDVYPSLDSPRSRDSEGTLENFNDKDYEKYQSLPCCEGSEGCNHALKKEFKEPYIVTETYDDRDDDVDDVMDSASVSMEAPPDGIETYNCLISPCISNSDRYKSKVSETVFVVFALAKII